MKKAAAVLLMLLATMMVSQSAMAQLTASGTLTVNATVASSINLVFNTDPSGVALTGSGTNAATLNFGTISAFGALAANVTRANGATNFTVSTPFDVAVQKYNAPSASYTLTAQLGAADAVNTWALGASTITNASLSTLTNAGAYGSAAYTLNLTVPNASAAGAIANTINFVATAN